MPYDARAVANVLLDYAESQLIGVTPMQLLKIIFFAHGQYLAKFGRPLIRHDFEAWERGPVVSIVYETFKNAGGKPIRSRAMRFDPLTNSFEQIPAITSTDDVRFLQAIFDAYGHLDGPTLSKMTHVAGSPWEMVWNGAREKASFGMVISNDVIRDYFSRIQ